MFLNDKNDKISIKNLVYFLQALVHSGNISVQLSKRATSELHSVYSAHTEYNPDLRCESFDLDSLSEEMITIRKNYLEKDPGFVVVDNFWNPKYSIEQGKNGLLVLSQLFGGLMPQMAATGLLVKEVKDRSKSFDSDSTSRYSDSKEGGGYHTDGAELPPPLPAFLTLLCIRQAENGGIFKVISAYDVHDALVEKAPESLGRLYRNFYWDRRGDLGPNGEETFEKPIFSYQNRTLTCEYLRRYIDDGYKKAGVVQTEEDVTALDALDSVLYDDSIAYNILMKPGQLVISANYYTLHGRTSFEDFDDQDLKRLMLRTWIKDKTQPSYSQQKYAHLI